MSEINCLRCKQTIDAHNEQCPHCGDKITLFQRTYSSRLLDGKYQIIDRLGVGGMGEIFKVRHIHLNELRVIKIMRAGIAQDEQGLQRFLQEARTSTMIKHRNLAMLYDFAQLDDGSYYMVWEFIDGTNIQKWIANTGAVPARLTVEIAIQALNGLEHLHSMGLIHRDISPENIMLSQDHHGKLLVKVIDFGIAKQLAEGDAGQGLTQTGMFLGKLKYASPEQAGFLKEGEHIDPRSDLYSFGVLMYEMLAGRAPFQATNPHGYILKHVTEKPVRISELNPGVTVPPALEAIIMRSLAKNRDERFATAGEFGVALEAIRNEIPPDHKYGLGERMITLSGAKTLAELPKITKPATTIGGAQPTQQTVARGTRAADEATVLERGTASPRNAGSDDATVMERFDGAGEATSLEPAMNRGAHGEATVLEQQIGAPSPAAPRKNLAVIAAAAVILVLVASGAWFALRKPQAPVTSAPPVAAGTEVTTTASAAPVPADQGVLLLSASPWGDIDRIVSKSDQKEVALDSLEGDRSTPTRILLAPGEYAVTLHDDRGSKTIDVRIQPGKSARHVVKMDDVDFDDLTRKVTSNP